MAILIIEDQIERQGRVSSIFLMVKSQIDQLVATQGDFSTSSEDLPNFNAMAPQKRLDDEAAQFLKEIKLPDQTDLDFQSDNVEADLHQRFQDFLSMKR